jgi:hypothetical protein
MAKLQQILVTQYQEYQAQMAMQDTGEELAPPTEDAHKPRQDWGEAPDHSIFYGRTQELAMLEDWIFIGRMSISRGVGYGRNWQNCFIGEISAPNSGAI